MSNAEAGTFEEKKWKSCRTGKSRWSAYEVGAMVLGFIVFWPLGLIALFLKWKNGEMWRGAAEGNAPWAGWKMPAMGNWQPSSHNYPHTGNAAFDDYKRTQLARLEEERRKLDDEQKAFREHLEKLRKAKDQEEFDRFMAERGTAPQV